ncbi:hypothetical protein BGW38_000348 [Lunasporangiospora selenospora]|uniref:tRNA(Phe) 7-[(3-amino-3-carboxypropyl)-4-demethylwyosine(37)-N(4)]-methyltransferase n=1 Tax=Lunasporangiospora selenospora TaxID=979761 RepID=A0A9P6FV00_9FUNG|nr:hypothetical protein BGW38_000348 [Lunasporangiospora selenospora]
MSDGFSSRKKTILVALNSDTPDKSPKGYVDEPLLPLIILVNNHPDYVTTSSCSGRICTYLEGIEESGVATHQDQDQEKEQTNNSGDDDSNTEVSQGYSESTSLAAVESTKRAKGGQWLYVSHDPVDIPIMQPKEESDWVISILFGPEAHRVVSMEESKSEMVDMVQSQLVYFKFEPMILHIEASTPTAAKTFLNHSLFSGYRNSGILPSAKRTMLAIRSTLKLDTPIAFVPTATIGSSPPKIHLMVSPTYLLFLLKLSNDKFTLNVAQIGRFENRLKGHLYASSSNDSSSTSNSPVTAVPISGMSKKKGDQGDWEDKDARRERKRREGLEKQQAAARTKTAETKAEDEAEEAMPEKSTQSQNEVTGSNINK